MTPARGGRLVVPGATIPYEVAGDGPPLVLMHAGICDRRMWDDTMPALSRRRTVIGYDLRGFGGSVVTGDVPFSHRADLVALLDELGIEAAAVVGVSLSGQIAIDAAIEFPGRFRALVAVAAGLSGADVSPSPAEAAAYDELERLEAARDWTGLVEADLRLWVDGLGGDPDRVADVREQVREMDTALYRDHADDSLDQVIRLDPPAAGRLGELRMPVLAIVGSLDTPESRTLSELVADGVPDGRLVVMDGVAHLPPMERPAKFVELVESFLDGIGA